MRSGLYFSVSVTARISLDELAREVSSALSVPLVLSQGRGTREDYVGQLLGLNLWLFVAEMFTADSPARFALIAGPDFDKEEDAVWLDVGFYIAEFLADRTGRAWEVGRGSNRGG